MGKPATDFLHKHPELTAAAAIALLVIVAYIPAMMGGFVWDDNNYVTENPLITAPDGLARIWFSLDSPSQYFPLVYTMFRIEHAIWGMHPFGYHLVNILLHAANAVLLWWVLRRLRIPGAWLAAAIWALHPVNVESVAWITERKNTLSLLFSLMTILAWMRFLDKDESRRWTFYGLAIGAHMLALFAKTTACTIPAALVVVLWLRHERLTGRRLLEISPFAVLGLAMGLVTVWWEKHHQGTLGAHFDFSLTERFIIAGNALWFYLGKLLLPIKLAFSYPQLKLDASNPLQYLWLAGVIMAAIALWKYRSKLGNGPITAAFFFTAMLSPMLGFISLYTFRYTFVADHYQYVACIGPITLLAAYLHGKGKSPALKYAVPAIILCVLGAMTWAQSRVYKDSETLWGDVLDKNPASWMAHVGLGVILEDQGYADAAMAHYQKALEINPNHWEAYLNMGALLSSQGKRTEAIESYEKGLKLRPADPRAHYGYANALARAGRLDDAISHYATALELDPRYADAHCNMGSALAQQGKLKEAADHFKAALKINPRLIEARDSLKDVETRLKVSSAKDAIAKDNPAMARYLEAMELHKQGKVAQAMYGYREAIRLKPDFAEAHSNLGLAFIDARRYDEAIAECRIAVQIKPDFGEAHNNLAIAYYLKGQPVEAWQEVALSRKHKVEPEPDFIAALTEMMPEPK